MFSILIFFILFFKNITRNTSLDESLPKVIPDHENITAAVKSIRVKHTCKKLLPSMLALGDQIKHSYDITLKLVASCITE